MAQDQKNTTWLVTVNDGTPNASTYRVTAAYPRTDQGNYPGYILLCDEDKTLVALVPDRPLLLIRRADSDPTARPAPKMTSPASAAKVTFTGSGPAAAASPAQMAALAQHAAKAARV